MTSAPRVLLVVPDLFFATRIRTAATHVGITVADVTAAAAAEACRQGRPALVIVDLGHAAALDALRGIATAPGPRRVVAFGSHVDRERLAAARDAGADEVLPRSAFTVRLPELLRAAAAAATDEG